MSQNPQGEKKGQKRKDINNKKIVGNANAKVNVNATCRPRCLRDQSARSCEVERIALNKGNARNAQPKRLG